jgi:hypothetical protein
LAPSTPEYLGNLVRAKVRRGDFDNGLREQMEQLRFIEHRPDWVRWVEERLIYLTARQERVSANSQPFNSNASTFTNDIDEASLRFEIGADTQTEVGPPLMPPANGQ